MSGSRRDICCAKRWLAHLLSYAEPGRGSTEYAMRRRCFALGSGSGRGFPSIYFIARQGFPASSCRTFFESHPATDTKMVNFLPTQISREPILARRLLREHIPLKKPPDAIHLATAVINNLDEFHTFDGVNLTPLSGLVNRADGVGLVICFPPENPAPDLNEYPP